MNLPAPPPAALPDYQGGSLLNLMASITAACGGAPLHPPLILLPPKELAPARNIILLLVDGLGFRLLRDSPHAPNFRRYLRGSLTSVFPSTTASAIATLFTGLAPSQHGITGWFTYLKQAQAVTAILPFETRGDARPLGELGIAPQDVFIGPPLFDTLGIACWALLPHRIADSDFSRFHCGRAIRVGYGGRAALFRQALRIVRIHPDRKLIYAYLPDLDALAHQRGIGSPQAARLLAALDKEFGLFLQGLAGTDTYVLVTGDHGFVDIPPEGLLKLEDHPELKQALAHPLSGESRVAYCRVKPDRCAGFEAYAADKLADHATLHHREKLLDEGWFGPGPYHPDIADRLGDYILVMRPGRVTRDHVPGETRPSFVGYHGGVTPDEMEIPLVLAKI